jgi:hypothetical protein
MTEIMFVAVLLAVALFAGIETGNSQTAALLVKQCSESGQTTIATPAVLSCKATHSVINGKTIPLNQEGK